MSNISNGFITNSFMYVNMTSGCIDLYLNKTNNSYISIVKLYNKQTKNIVDAFSIHPTIHPDIHNFLNSVTTETVPLHIYYDENPIVILTKILHTPTLSYDETFIIQSEYNINGIVPLHDEWGNKTIQVTNLLVPLYPLADSSMKIAKDDFGLWNYDEVYTHLLNQTLNSSSSVPYMSELPMLTTLFGYNITSGINGSNLDIQLPIDQTVTTGPVTVFTDDKTNATYTFTTTVLPSQLNQLFTYNTKLMLNTPDSVQNGLLQLFQNKTTKTCSLTTNVCEILLGDSQMVNNISFENFSLQNTAFAHIITKELGSINAMTLVHQYNQMFKSSTAVTIEALKTSFLNTPELPSVIDQCIKNLKRTQSSSNLGFMKDDVLKFSIYIHYHDRYTIQCLVKIVVVDELSPPPSEIINITTQITF